MNVRLVTTPEDFAALRSAWETLVQECGRQCLFLSHDWFDAAWQWRREAGALYILCCLSEGRLAGVLPLVRLHARESMGARALEFLAVPDTQVCDVIALPDLRDAVMTAFAAELARRSREWDVVRLRYLPEDSIAATSLARAMSVRGMRGQTRQAATNLLVPLDGIWDEYYTTRSRRLKKAVNLAANRLGKTGDVSIDRRGPEGWTPGEIESAVSDVTDVSARSWKSETGNSLDQPGPQAFIRRLSVHAAKRGWLAIWTLRVDARLLAMEYQLQADGDVYALRSDFDAGCEEISPGSHLSRHLLERLFGCGLRRYLMGPGSNAYKLRWAAGEDAVHELVAYGTSLSGRAKALWELALKPPLRRVRDRLRSVRQSGREKADADLPAGRSPAASGGGS